MVQCRKIFIWLLVATLVLSALGCVCFLGKEQTAFAYAVTENTENHFALDDICSCDHEVYGRRNASVTTHRCSNVNYNKLLPTSGELDGNYYLSENVTLTDCLTIAQGKTVRICLNGKVLNLNKYNIQNNGTLTITDCGTTIRYFSDAKKKDENQQDIEGADGCYETYSSGISDGAMTSIGGVITGGYSTDALSSERFGAIYNNGTLKILYGSFIGNYSDKGAVIYNNSGTTTITKGTFSGNLAKDGGVIYVNAGEVVINGGTYSVNTAKSNGGAISNNGTLTLTAGVFSGNSANDAGVVFNRATFTLSGGTLYNNTATYGGVVDNEGTVTLNGGIITGNKATTSGGAIYNSKTLTLNNCSISVNTAKYGGAVYNSAGEFVMNGGNIFDNKLSEDSNGGAIYNYGSGSIEITGGTLSGNYATMGGVCYNDSGTIAISGGTFSDNSATCGGVLDNGSTLHITGGIFSSNSATNYAGVISNRNTLTISNATFSSNEATNSAGVIYNGEGNVTIDSGMFTDNSSAKGGAIYSDGGVLKINKGTFESNTATNGGAINVDKKATVTFGDVMLTNNSATNGGAVASNNSSLQINKCIAKGNTATTNGGVIQINGGTLTIEGGTFSGNDAHYGGSIFNETSVVTINGGLFSDSVSAEMLGGVVFNSNGSVTVNGGIFTSNNVKSGGAIYNSKMLNITGGTFNSNKTTEEGGAIYSTGTVTVDNGTFTDNSSSSCGGAFYSSATLTINNGTFLSNSATLKGGAIYNANALSVAGGTFNENSAKEGGAFYSAVKSSTTFTGGAAKSNVACFGAGLCLYGTGSLLGGTITGNKITNEDGTYAQDYCGAGIYAVYSNSLTIGGNAVVKDNLSNDSQDNIGVNNASGSVLFAISTETPLIDGAYIGLHLATITGIFVEGATSDCTKYFHCDIADTDELYYGVNVHKIVVEDTETFNYSVERKYGIKYCFNTEDTVIGTLPVDLSKYFADGTVELNTDVFTREGYNFIGWNNDGSAQEKLSAYVVNTDDAVASNVTLYGIWKEKKNVEVTYDTESNTFVYDGKEHEASYTSEFDGISITYSRDGITWTSNLPMSAGTYKVNIYRLETETHKKFSQTVDLVINKADAIINTENVQTNYTYNGSEHVIESGATLNHTETQLVYKNNKFTNVGTGSYVVTIYANETDNYNGNSVDVEIFVTKADAVINTENVQTNYTYDGSEHVIESGATLNHTETQLVYKNNKFTNVGTGSYVVTIYADETDNYNGKSVDVEIFVAKANSVINIENVQTNYTYNGTEQIVESGATLNHTETQLVYENNKFTNVGTGSYVVTIYADETGNYNGNSVDVEIFVAKASATLSECSVENWTYGETAKLPQCSSNFGNIEVTYSLSGENDFTADVPVSAGKYIVKFVVADTNDYNGFVEQRELTISKANAVIDTLRVITNYTYNGSEQVLDSGATLNHSETQLVYDNNKFTDAGSYTVTISASETADYNAVSTDVVVVVRKAFYNMNQVEIVNTSVVYNGTEQCVEAINLPVGLDGKCVTASYSQGLTEPGTKQVVITFATESINYVVPSSMCVTMVVNSADIDLPIDNGTAVAQIVSDGYEDAVLQVMVKVYEGNIASATTSLAIDYQSQLGRFEELYGVYDIKLYKDGIEQQPSDIVQGEVVTVKMLLPSYLKDRDFRILHVHSESDIGEIVKGDEAEIGTYVIEDGYIVTQLDKLSEFAFIYEVECTAHYYLLGICVVCSIMLLMLAYVFKKTQFSAWFAEIIMLVLAVLNFVCIAYVHCTFCVVLLAVTSVLISMALLFVNNGLFGRPCDNLFDDDKPKEK